MQRKLEVAKKKALFEVIQKAEYGASEEQGVIMPRFKI